MTTPATEPLLAGARPTGGRAGRLAAPLGLAAVALAGAAALHVRDPHEQGSWGFCPFLVLTGHPCPGCGGLRAVNDLTHGDVVAAASSNLLFVASLPVLLWFWVRWVRRAWTGAPAARSGATAAWVGLALVVTFWVVRNLPFATWLLP